MKLYEIPKAIEQATNMIDEDGVITEEWLALLDNAENTLTEKADNIWIILQEKDNKIDAIKKEIERLNNRKKKEEKQKEQLKDYLSKNIFDLSPDWIQWERFKFSFRKSESVEIEDMENIPKSFIDVKVTEVVNKKSIKEAIKEWIKVKGTKIETKYNLQIN